MSAAVRFKMSLVQINYYEARGLVVENVEGLAENGNTVYLACGRVDKWIVAGGTNKLSETKWFT